MKETDIKQIVSSACLSAFCLILGLFIGDTVKETKYQKEAIKRGYAEYSSTTGEWKWKEIRP